MRAEGGRGLAVDQPKRGFSAEVSSRGGTAGRVLPRSTSDAKPLGRHETGDNTVGLKSSAPPRRHDRSRLNPRMCRQSVPGLRQINGRSEQGGVGNPAQSEYDGRSQGLSQAVRANRHDVGSKLHGQAGVIGDPLLAGGAEGHSRDGTKVSPKDRRDPPEWQRPECQCGHKDQKRGERKRDDHGRGLPPQDPPGPADHPSFAPNVRPRVPTPPTSRLVMITVGLALRDGHGDEAVLHHAVSHTREFLRFAGARRIGGVAGLMMAGAVVEGISLALLLPLLGSMTDGEGRLRQWSEAVFARLGAEDDVTRLAVTLSAFVAAMIVRGLVLMARDRAASALQARYVEHCRQHLLGALARAAWPDVAGLKHARITHALSVEVGRVAMATHAGLTVAAGSVMMAAQLILTFALSWIVGLASLGIMVTAAVVSVGRLRRAAKFGDEMRQNGLKLTHTAAQLLGGLKQAAAENRQADFVADYAAAGDMMVALQIEDRRRSTRFHFLATTSVAVGGAAVVMIGVQSGSDLTALLAITLVLSRMASHAVGLQRDAELLASSLPGKGMLTALERELISDQPPAAASGRPPAGMIQLRNVEYRYDGGDRGVRGISLSIHPGEMVGVTGPSGAGKTTLVDLMIGLLPAQGGTVEIGGEALLGSTAWQWRNRIAYVGQDAFLTHDTIRANLATGQLGEVDDEALWTALATAGVDEAVRRMPHDLETVLAERGSRLSGGERQRIAIARAVLRRPALLVLDEATSAIDVETERAILTRLRAINGDMTIIVVAHRSDTLANCPRVITVAGGRLVADERTTG